MIYVFLLVNPRSGGGAACEFLTLGFNYLYLKRKGIKLIIESILSGNGDADKPVFRLIRRVTDSKCTSPATCRLMVAGGDGTLTWAVQCLRSHRVNTTRLSIGVIPFGTGNDFAHAAGCSSVDSKPEDGETAIDMMRRLLDGWLSYEPVPFDLWSVRVVANANGGAFTKIDSETRKKRVIRDACSIPLQELNFAMANYFSLGVESRIGIGFDRNRKDNTTYNKAAYVFEAFKKLIFHRAKIINKLINRIEIRESFEDPWSILCLTKPDPKLPQLPLLSPCVSLVLLNIPSFAGGLDIWKAASGKLGLLKPASNRNVQDYTKFIDSESEDSEASLEKGVDVENWLGSFNAVAHKSIGELLKMPITNEWEAESSEYMESPRAPLESLPVDEESVGTLAERVVEWSKIIRASSHGKQSVGDGQLDIVSFKSLVELSLSNFQRIMPKPPSSGWRISQTGKTIKLVFNKKMRRTERIYFQVDGEFFIGQRLKQ